MTGTSSSVVRFLLFIFAIVLADAAPHRAKSKNKEAPQLVYDQKQTGDYNIQLHMKDFQIIALLGDDSLGDYDYNYDYADFTIKPSGSSTSTTPKPTSTTPSTTTVSNLPSSTATSSSTTVKPTSNKPLEIDVVENSHSNPSSTLVSNLHPIGIVVLEPTKKPLDAEKIKVKASKKPTEESEINNSKDTAFESYLNEILSSTLSSSQQSSTDALADSSSTSTVPSIPSSSTSEPITPGKIKVQILEGPPVPEIVASVPVGIVPGEDVHSEVDGGILQGELASYRKCVSGFSRDKRGRCRRVRRPGVAPQLPFGFSRIASNLATRLRLPSNEKAADAPNLD